MADQQTTVTAKRSTIAKLRLVGAEMSVFQGQILRNDNDRLQALLNHYESTKDRFSVQPTEPEVAA